MDLFIAFSLVLRNDKARIAAIALSPAPFIGVVFCPIPVQETYQIGLMLMYTGVSFPAMYIFSLPLLSPLALLYVVNTVRVFLGILNLSIPLYIRSEHVRRLFHSKEPLRIV